MDNKRVCVQHGLSYAPIYWIYRGMLDRCHLVTNKQYPDYGGRGIYVCERWRQPNSVGLFAFIADMGERPEDQQVERIDNHGPYSPENCRWASRKEQGRNKRNNHYVAAWGETKVLSEWAEDPRCVVHRRLVTGRLARLWDPEDALSTPATRTNKCSSPPSPLPP